MKTLWTLLTTPVSIPKTACPLCGCRAIEDHPEPGMLVCTKCSETLYTSELVLVATPLTTRRYRKANP